MKRSNSVRSAAKTFSPCSSASEQWMWHELPSRLVELRHERDRHVLLGGDLLGAVLVDHVPVGGRERLAVAEVDLVLAEVALALGVLDHEVGGAHLVADPADQGLDPRRAEQRVVDVVEVRRLEVAVRLLPGLLVGVLEDDELELGARVGDPAALGEPGELAAEDLARGGDHLGAVAPLQVGEQHHRALVPRHRPQRVEVGDHLEVAVAALPRGHRVAADRLHVDVDGEQVVAALGAVLERVVEEVARGQALALQPALHVRDREQHGVDRAVRDRLLQLVERHATLTLRDRVGAAVSSASSRTSRRPAPSMLRTWPVKWLPRLQPAERGATDHDQQHERRVVRVVRVPLVVPWHPERARRQEAGDADDHDPDDADRVHPPPPAARGSTPSPARTCRPCASAGRSGSRNRCRARSRRSRSPRRRRPGGPCPGRPSAPGS